jgi:hypothetical protein
MEAIEKNQLRDRTRLRNASLRVELDWGGLMTPLAAQQAILDSLGQPGIENFMAIQDENFSIKEFQRDRTHELNQAEIDNQIKIADDEIATRKETLAIQKVTDAYVVAVAAYKAKVNALIMGAREYAAQVELEQLDVERQKSILAVAKEGLHQKQVNASIYYEYIQRLMVEADIAKAQVDVAKANVRAIMADIAAGEADIRVITAQIEQFMAQADKATLQADVAMIYAEILTKKLSAVKLDIGQKEIAAGFGYIQSRYDDMLTKLATQKAEELLQVDYANMALAEANLIFPDEKASEDLRKTEQLDARDVFTYTEKETDQNIQDETALRSLAVNAREALSDQRLGVSEAKDIKATWAQALINSAHKQVYGHRLEIREVVSASTETIAS